MHITEIDPGRDCDLCPRLVEFRSVQREKFPSWHNAPVDTWAAEDPTSVKLLVAGLAPGLKGANCTGRPFTGDYAGDLLYATLDQFGLTHGSFDARADDGLKLHECAITNAVRCVPPENKPVGAEINACRPFLVNTIRRFENLKVIVTLGKISHDSVIRALNGKISQNPFGHCQTHSVDNYHIISSYHCSRYNTNTGRLTPEMFAEVFKTASNLMK